MTDGKKILASIIVAIVMSGMVTLLQIMLK